MDKQQQSVLTEDEKYNRASQMQLFLFSFNNLSTNLPYVVISSYLLFYAQSYLMLSAVIVGWIITGMRLFDGITDPIIGFLIDKTDTKYGKFRPWMVIGNIIINLTFIGMFALVNPEWSDAMKLAVFLSLYFIHILGYSMQTASTKGGGTIITSDPSQRPALALYMGAFGMVLMVVFMAIIPAIAKNYEKNMLDPQFWSTIVVITVVFSFIFMIMAVAGIWKKDIKENYQGFTPVKLKLKDFVSIIKQNRAIQMLVIAAATDKLAFSLSGAVTIYFYSNVLLNQDLMSIMTLISLPLIIVFCVIGTIIAKKTTQKKAFVISTWFAMILSIISIFVFPDVGDEVGSLSVTIFLVVFALRNGMNTVPGTFVTTMISDCADYETYLSGKAVPGMMGTLFSFVDKVVSSLNGLVIAVMFAMFGLQNTVIVPLTPSTEYEGLRMIIITGLIVLPIIGYICSIIAMRFYPLDKEKMEEVKNTIALYKESANDPRTKK